MAAGVGVVRPIACAQTVFAPRAAALGAYTASVTDGRGFALNPAGLVNMKDWDFSSTTYLPTSLGGKGFVFHGFTLGKKFLEDNAAAVQYAPGASLDFIIPYTARTGGVSIAADRRISYTEPFVLGVAHRFSGRIAAGMNLRLQTETLDDPQFQIDTALFTVPNEHKIDRWLADVGVSWKPSDDVTLAAEGRSLLTASRGSFPDQFQNDVLPRKAAGMLGISWDLSRAIRTAADVGTERNGAVGCEYAPGGGLALRTGVYMRQDQSPFAYAVGVGAGWGYDMFEIDAGYLHFLNQEHRKGVGEANTFDASVIDDIGMNAFASDRISLSVKVVLGRVREQLVRIESVAMLSDVYPATSAALAYRPICRVRVKNVSPKPIQARATFFVDKFMDTPAESPAVYLAPGEAVDIPVTAVFNDRVKSVSSLIIREGNVSVAAAMTDDPDDRCQARTVIHGKNDWDGDVHSLRYFVSPDNPDIIRCSRDLLLEAKDSLFAVPRGLELFEKAKTVLDAFTGKLLYVGNPKHVSEVVQYPSETLRSRGGNCSDMSVFFASLLSSIGVSTAFVEVVPRGHPEDAHLYLLFDTSLEPQYGESITGNPKRYVVRKNAKGVETIWIPVETTDLTRGFIEAWSSGAQEFFDDAEVGLGLIQGWVRIVDVY